MPNGVGGVEPKRNSPDRRPECDRDREDRRYKEAVPQVARHLGHGHAGMAAVAVAVRILGALGGGVIVHGRVAAFLGEWIADMARHRTTCAVEATLLNPLL